MPMTEREALACLRMIVCMAQIDGKVTDEEKAVLEDVLTGIRLPAGVTADTMLNEDVNLDVQLRQITSELGREQACLAAYSMAYADRECTADEKRLLRRIRERLDIPEQKVELWKRIIGDARDTVLPSRIIAVPDPEERKKNIDRDVLKYAIWNGALGALTTEDLVLFTDLAVVGIQMKTIRDIGLYWGEDVDRSKARSILHGAAGNPTTRMVITTLAKWVPSWGSGGGSRVPFAITWGIGKAAQKYFEMEGGMKFRSLRDVFVAAKSEGLTAHEEHKEAITAKQSQNEARVRELCEHLKTEQISEEEFESQIEQLA